MTLLGLLAAGCSAHTQPHQGSFAVASGVVTAAPLRDPPIHYPAGVSGYQALTYAQWPGFRPLTLDLYVPPAPFADARFPLVLFVHGGAWQSGDPRRAGAIEDFPALLAAFAARGYVVASISYRLSSEARFPAAAADVRAALRWLRTGARYPIDRARTILWGASAGAHLAALAATACESSLFDPPGGAPVAPPESDRPADDCVDGVVAWYGIFDLRTLDDQAGTAPGAAAAPHWAMLGCTGAACGERLEQASPSAWVGRRSPPMLLIAGTEDRIVPARQSVAMAERLSQAGVPHRLLLIEGVDHSFIGPDPEATGEATRRAVEATFQFIEEILASPADEERVKGR